MSDAQDGFEKEAKAKPPGIVVEFWEFLVHSKKFWLLPILLVLLILGALVSAGGTGAAPFIYTLF